VHRLTHEDGEDHQLQRALGDIELVHVYLPRSFRATR
jgi:hypothetical protein